jgi:aspartate/methionine/tyrosine aminotransferase
MLLDLSLSEFLHGLSNYIYTRFLSMWKVLMEMGPPISKGLQLVSFHTVSKGYWGECGQRGGYFEMTNIPPKVCLSITC